MTPELATGTSATADIHAEWSDARLLYPLYCALARECVIDLSPCHDLEKLTGDPSEESLNSAGQWFTQMDDRIEVYQLRHFLQTTTTLADDAALQALLRHHLRKPEHNNTGRNKTDFLLVQLFSLWAPSHLPDNDLDLPCVARILEPVLGEFDLAMPDWLQPVDELSQKAQKCQSLKELFTSRVIEQGRQLKESCGDRYFSPIAMAAFTRYGFLLRRVFFRLMQQDLSAILNGLRDLEARGIESLDCRKAQFSAYEPLVRLRMICQSWKVMFHAEYSSGQPLCLLVDLRTAVEAALAKAVSGSQSSEASSTEARSRAAVAGTDQVMERPAFEVFDAPAGAESEISSTKAADSDDNLHRE
jgi:hypothetical protein